MNRSAESWDDKLFEAFAKFRPIHEDKPLFYCKPPEWAAAAHAIVVGDTIHYLWGRRKKGNYWVLMHSTAPAKNPGQVCHDARNPVLLPSKEGFDDFTAEYPFPFLNPADSQYYAYYLGRRKHPPKQTGLLVSNGDLGQWTRVSPTPVISAEQEYERKGSSHPSVAVVENTIHILYTGESDTKPVICHATAPTQNPESVVKDSANPIFNGSGQTWDSEGVREAEIFMGQQFFHILYGGFDGRIWQIGHIRTRDFRHFESNPGNPIFGPSADRSRWDCDGILTPHVFQSAGSFYMLYAGLRGSEWQSGLAKTWES